MSDPPSSEPGPEFAIDLDAGAEAVPESTTSARRIRIPNSALAIAATIITLTAAVIATIRYSDEPLAAATVRAFLEAVHDGDVEGALALTDEPDAQGDFLVPEALDSRWHINTIDQVEYRSDETGTVAQVYAEIEADDGTKLGHRYSVQIRGERARIANPFIEADYYPTVGHLELNGVSVKSGGELKMRLLPGLYTLYETVPDTLKVETRSALALGGKFRQLGEEYTSDFLPWVEVRATESGLAEVESLVHDRLAGCAVEPELEGCPFNLPQDDQREVAVAPGAEWEVVAYPTFVLNAWYEEDRGFQLVTVEPGRASVAVDVTEEDGSTRRAVLGCSIWVEHLYAAFDFEGGVTLETGEGVDRTCNAMVEAS
ncbi:hypothetical protein [Glycomyces buryatensis]|uniref:Uncharacterized protein n=1 Tax=Glycomyces buryatensis TaxID=2570927 RepID=A0A4S8QJX2_9ACTN|nr:hypothetical protein [Glycomyces buryatensis]THV43602.1 hypothetical protein FAB82_00665 [Glycomyces buryatensis]